MTHVALTTPTCAWRTGPGATMKDQLLVAQTSLLSLYGLALRTFVGSRDETVVVPRTVPATTDMAEFDESLRAEWCHYTVCMGGPTLCGLSSDYHPHSGFPNEVVCSGCGRRNCPECMRLEAARTDR